MAARNTLVECYSSLEKANTDYLVAALSDIQKYEKEANYLNKPHHDLMDALFTYDKFMEREED